jgi:hypothetical protein
MRYFLFIVLFLGFPLFAERITLDPNARSYEMHPHKKERIDVFDFEGKYPDLENIDINARKKKYVEFYLTGDYPQLETLNYEGSFGILVGKLTGQFPKLSLVNIFCTNCAMKLDLAAEWQKSCEITIRGEDEDIYLTLPQNIGLVIHTKTGVKGKVIANESLKKKNRFGILKKTFENELAETSEVVLTLTIEAGEGRIILN